MPPPCCPECGITLTENLSGALRKRCAEAEGLKWSWATEEFVDLIGNLALTSRGRKVVYL